LSGFLLDANVVGERIRPGGARRVRDWLDAQHETVLFISVLVLAEFEKGLHAMASGNPHRRQVAEMVSGSGRCLSATTSYAAGRSCRAR